jgi:hypothetical protein
MSKRELRDRATVESLRTITEPRLVRCIAEMPYDGCWCEPNFWLWQDGFMRPLFVSGRLYDDLFKGRDLETILEGVSLDAFLEALRDRWCYEDFEILPTTVGVGNNWLNTLTVLMARHGIEETPVWTCKECGKDHSGVAAFLGYRGNGGIGINLESPCCRDCFDAIQICPTCGRQVTWEEDQSQCPCCGPVEDPEPAEDQAVSFGLDGRRFLRPGEEQGPPPVIVIVQKN